MPLLRTTMRLAAAATLLMAAQAVAQTSGSAPPAGKPDDQNAPQHFDSQDKKQNDQTLSERLDRSDGVIKPPSHVDREMMQPPPPSADSNMVIKPPVDEKAVKPK